MVGTVNLTFDDGIYFTSIKDREIEKLHREISKLRALVDLYHAVNKVVPLSLSKRNIKCREKRKMILSSVLDASKIVGLETATRFIGNLSLGINAGGLEIRSVRLVRVILVFVVILTSSQNAS